MTVAEKRFEVTVGVAPLVLAIARLTDKEEVTITIGEGEEIFINTLTGNVVYLDEGTDKEVSINKVTFSE